MWLVDEMKRAFSAVYASPWFSAPSAKLKLPLNSELPLRHQVEVRT